MRNTQYPKSTCLGLMALVIVAAGACDDGGLARIEADFALEADSVEHVHLLGAPSQFFVTAQNLKSVPLRIALSVSVGDAELADVVVTPPMIDLAAGASVSVTVQVAGHHVGESEIEVHGDAGGLERQLLLRLLVEEACPELAECDDNNACTANDICTENMCVGETVTCPVAVSLCRVAVCDADEGCVEIDAPGVCDDGNPCTEDRCDDALGCSHEPMATGTPCGVRDGCVSWSFCEAGECVAQPVPDGAPCDDGDACSMGDVCVGQLCAGTPDDNPGAILQTVHNYGARGATVNAIDDDHLFIVDRPTTGVGATFSVVRREEETLSLARQLHDDETGVSKPAPIAVGAGQFLVFRTHPVLQTGLEHRVELWRATPNELILLDDHVIAFNDSQPEVVYSSEHQMAYLLWLSRYEEHGFAGLTPIGIGPEGLDVLPAIELSGAPQGVGLHNGELLARTRTYGQGESKFGTTYRLALDDPGTPEIVEETHEENFYFGRDCYAVTDDYTIGGRVADLVGSHGIILRENAGGHLLVNEDLTSGSYEALGCFHLGANWAVAMTHSGFGTETVRMSLFNFDARTDGPILTKDLAVRTLASSLLDFQVTGTGDVIAVGSASGGVPDPARLFVREGETLTALSGIRSGEWGRLVQQGGEVWSYQAKGVHRLTATAEIILEVVEKIHLPRRSDVITNAGHASATGWRSAFERYGNIQLGVTAIGPEGPVSVALNAQTLAATAAPAGTSLYALENRPGEGVVIRASALDTVGNMNLTSQVAVGDEPPYDFNNASRIEVSSDGRRVVGGYAYTYALAHVAVIDIGDDGTSTATIFDVESPFELSIIDDERISIQTRGELRVATVAGGTVSLEPMGDVPWMSDAVGSVGDDLFLGDDDGLHRVDLNAERPRATMWLPDRPQALLPLANGNIMVSTPTALMVIEPPCAVSP